ncbi:MAG: Uma2 family endonuclease [Aquificae bacterium]|nr:Uma2 family endonuclease [Aquificota bacterium]
MVMTLKTPLSSEERRKLLKLLTYEKVRGKPIYYRGYEKVLRGELPPEAVMGSSELQALIVALLVKYLFESLPEEFVVLTNELGFRSAPRTFRSLDIAIYKKEDLKKPSSGYATKPPLAVIEIDTKADLSRYGSFEEYAYEKTQELLDAGVERVIWFITKVKKVLIAEKGKDWLTKSWESDIPLPGGVKLNLGELLKKEGIEI